LSRNFEKRPTDCFKNIFWILNIRMKNNLHCNREQEEAL
jgi:hypothetical protein